MSSGDVRSIQLAMGTNNNFADVDGDVDLDDVRATRSRIGTSQAG